MRFRKLLLVVIFFFHSFFSGAQDFGFVENPGLFDKGFIDNQFQKAYSLSPAHLSSWNLGKWSNISSGYDYGKGNFRNPLKNNRFSSFVFSTESLTRTEDNKWVLYGLFRYSNGSADSIHANVSYHESWNGSPYYHFINRPGNWKLQNYEFNVAVARQLHKKVSLGARILYNGDLAFRQNDTRNNQTSLFSNAAFSGNYQVHPLHAISLGVEYKRVKAEPNLSNKYNATSTGPDYTRHINSGLGSQIRGVDFKVEVNDVALGGFAQWQYKPGQNNISLFYRHFSGEENYINKNLRVVNDENRVLNYTYNQHEGIASGLFLMGGGFLNSFVQFKQLRGNGNQYNNVSKTFLNNYTLTKTSASFSNTYYLPQAFLKKISLNMDFQSEERFDKAFGYTFSFMHFTPGVYLEFQNTLRKNLLSWGAGANYQMTLDYLNDPKAAHDNLYTRWIANPLMAYLSTDYLSFPVHISARRVIRGNMLELRLAAEHFQPMAIPVEEHAFFNLQDKFLFINGSIQFYF